MRPVRQRAFCNGRPHARLQLAQSLCVRPDFQRYVSITRMTPLRRIAAAAVTAALLAVPAVASAPAASAFTGDNAAVVNGWYEDFLGRTARTDLGANYWVQRLEVQAPGDVLWSITHSPEFNATQIDAYYQGYLGREPDPGADYWLDGVNSGAFPLEWVEQNILASEEFDRRVTRPRDRLSGSNLITAWYAAVLGRPAQAGEGAYWGYRVEIVGRLGALRELWFTPEGVAARISANYALLEREPSLSEIDYWYFKEIESDINVAVLIASTPEYRSQQS